MRKLMMFAGLVGLSACSPGIVEVPLDQDGDGLLSDLEAELGTDPFAADTDGDGYSDSEEFEIGTDPTDLFDRPYIGGWPMDKCADSVVGTGHQIGETVEDFQLQDQYGDLVRMYDFCNHTVLLVESAFG
jgi:hypothetical protein